MPPIAATLLILTNCLVVSAAAAWHQDLFVPGNDTWHARIPVDIANSSDTDAAGFPVQLTVGTEPGMIDIVGENARAVRVCDSDGTEMLFDLIDERGIRLKDGPIPAGATLILPAAAPAGGSQRLYVYFDNPEAYLLPEYLSAGTTIHNPGFEMGSRGLPDAWRFDNGDADHSMSWVEQKPHSGTRCVRMAAAPGSQPRWATVRQTGLRAIPGASYRITAWVRGQDISGKAGWFVHVSTPDDPLAVNIVKGAAEGTFDWTQVEIEFTAPAEALHIDHGSVLYGTGTAWFDDVHISQVSGGRPALSVHVGPTEHLPLERIDGDGSWWTEAGRTFNYRAPIHVINRGAEAVRGAVRARAARISTILRRGFNPDSLRIIDPSAARVLPHTILRDHLVFSAAVPPRSIKTFHACFTRRADIPPAPGTSFQQLAGSAANMLANPSFERGDGTPADWAPMGVSQQEPVVDLDRVGNGRFGQHCVRITVPPDAEKRWTGWRQDVPVKPNTDYLLMSHVRTENITDGHVRLHAHMHHDETDEDPTIWSAGPDLTGTTDWTLIGGIIHTGPRINRIIVYLTMNARGTAWHDGAILLPATSGRLGDIRTRVTDETPSLQIWTENPIIKVFRDTPPQPQVQRIRVHAARGERQSVQLCMRASQPIDDLEINVTKPHTAAGSLPPPRIERVGYVPCLQPSGFFRSDAAPWQRRKPPKRERSDGWRGWWPDYLTPIDGPRQLPEGITQPFLITYIIPTDSLPGRYRASIDLTTANGEQASIPVDLTVWTLQLPDRPTLQALFDLRNGPGWSLYDTAEKRNHWWRFMARHRICSDRVLPEPEFSLVDGQVTMDAAQFDRSAHFYFDQLHMAAAYFPQVFYCFGWGHEPRGFLGLDYSTAEYRKAYKQGVRLFWDHVTERGWADRYSLYVSDEPHYDRPGIIETLSQVVNLTREVDPEIPVYSSTWGHVPEWDGILNHWGIAQYGRFPLDALEERRAAGDKIWFTTDGQLILDTPYNAYERMLPYYCFAYDVSGYEFWALPWYTYDPFKFGWYSYLHHTFAPGDTAFTRYPNGSGHLAYPGDLIGRDGPLSTVRLVQIREGIEDYEILMALRRLAEQKPQLRPRIGPIFDDVRAMVPIPNAGGYRSTDILPDPDRLTSLRQRAGNLLEELTSH